MERIIAMQAPICTTRLLPTRVSCRHPMFSLSERTQHSSGFEDVWLPFPHIIGMRASTHTSRRTLQQHHAHMSGKEMHTSLSKDEGPGGRTTHMLLLHCQSL